MSRAGRRAQSRPRPYWDWSTAGRDDIEEDHYTYLKIKGSFVSQTDIEPEYTWYNGTADRYLLGDTIDPTTVTSLNTPNGSIDDPTARIFPFKIHVAKQIYDSEYDYLLQPKTVGEGGFWTEFDWDLAAELGAEATDMAYSGSYDFAETEMYWPLTHMVQPGERALQCQDCHDENGRMDWQALGYPGDPMYSGSRNTGAPSQASSAARASPREGWSAACFAHFRFRRRITVAALLTAGIVVTALVMLAATGPGPVDHAAPHLPAAGTRTASTCSTGRAAVHHADVRQLPRHGLHRRAQLSRRRGAGAVRRPRQSRRRTPGTAAAVSSANGNPLTYRYLSRRKVTRSST
ncbi:MAG: hypothetical protein R2838_08960 [Caldilineaceae bacterium]